MTGNVDFIVFFSILNLVDFVIKWIFALILLVYGEFRLN